MGGKGRSKGKGGKSDGHSKNPPKKSSHNRQTHPTPFDQISTPADTESNCIPCSLCAESRPLHVILTACGHVCCYKCCLRIRFLQDDKSCPICKTDSKTVFLTSSPKKFEDWNESVGGILRTKKADSWGLVYDTGDIGGGTTTMGKKQMQNLVNDLFAYKCWICDSPDFRTLWDLQRHVEHWHGKTFCKCCLNSRDIFLQEQMVYAGKEEVGGEYFAGYAPTTASKYMYISTFNMTTTQMNETTGIFLLFAP